MERPDLVSAVARGDFIESAEFSGNMYGTSYKAVENVTSKGKICVLDIEMQGVKQVRPTLQRQNKVFVATHFSPQIKDKATLPCQYVFIRPPSMEVLEQRLRERGTETEEALQKRLDTAKREMEYGTGEEEHTQESDETDITECAATGDGNFDVVVTNDDLDKAYQQLREFIVPEVNKVAKSS